MADIELVIKIPQETYDFLKKYGTDGGIIEKAVLNGTPLPKGHGRLIDADAVLNQEYGCYWETQKDLEHAPTIVEANRSEDDEDNRS